MDLVPPPVKSLDLFFHVRMLMGIVIGFGFTHLLRGIARIIEHPKEHGVYWVHMLWVVSTLLYLMHFWWWEFRLSWLPDWRFDQYFFIVVYALLLYFLCALLLPERLDGYRDYREYYFSRRRWIFGVLALVYLADFGDTLLKGEAYFLGFGVEYIARNICYITACVLAIVIRKPAYHAVFVTVSIVYQVYWILRQFETLGWHPS